MREAAFELPGCTVNYPGQGRVYLAMPEQLAAGRPVVAALHGSGREAESYRDVPFYVFQRDAALSAGYCFAALSNGPDGWGLDHGLANLLQLHEYLTAELGTDPGWVLWGTSAGGVLMHRMVHEHPERVRGVIGTFPVYDLFDAFRHSPGCGRAWGAATEAELRGRVGGRNPPEYVADLAAREYLIMHGREDALLDPRAHTLRFAAEVAVYAGRVEVVMTDGGHSTENRAVCDADAVHAHLSRWLRRRAERSPTSPA